MSVTKNKETKYHETPQDVRFNLNWLRMDNLDNLKNVSVRGGLVGKVGTASGEVDKAEAGFNLTEIKANFSAQEKQAAKLFIAACEREICGKVAELAGETYDDTDVFVDNSDPEE